ncbi:MAG TPA: protein translocase subunit SecF [Candidatus Acidoferrales bacterium]|nr:protein translocase subunit SecF [Candidatus Acidoferrales bacterium]
MELFRGVNVDWMGKAKYFVTLSLLLLAIGWISIYYRVVVKHGTLYGIDFRGGTLVYVRFAGPPPMDKLRKGLEQAGLRNSTLQGISDTENLGSKNKNDVVIGLEQSGSDESLDTGKQKILGVLETTFGNSSAGLPDFNSVSTSDLAGDLTRRDPLLLGTNAGDRYNQLAQHLTAARDSDYGGIVTNSDQLSHVQGVTPAVIQTLARDYTLGGFTIRDAEIVGPRVGSQLRHQAVWATLYALGGMLVYIAFRFEWVYGAAAVIAVFHDVLITLGFFSLFHYEISLTVIAALLTLVGYSMNDTIVIFDRVRENLRLMKRESFPEIVNRSINQTLSRTILTSGLTFLTVLVLYLMGGAVLRAFSFAMVVGVVVGTYSSFGIAAPIVVVWNKYHGGRQQRMTVRAGSAAEKRVVAAARR